DELCAELARLANGLVVGDGLAAETQLGPLQNREQLAIVEALADDARRRGARILCGGQRLAGAGYFYAPTVIADAKDGMRVVDEEQFGPLVPVLRYRDIDDAIARANAGDNGLGGSVWGADTARATELAQRLDCGTAWVNEHGAVQPDAPFGGVKQSGIGVEFGRHGLAEYTSLQTVKVMKR
ncbi:MAG TPA: aldehyde dehydrogenase family protein, partial [Azospira sp.]|nr:aldehyde dehydrogenase family protein [Azospira sp.]